MSEPLTLVVNLDLQARLPFNGPTPLPFSDLAGDGESIRALVLLLSPPGSWHGHRLALFSEYGEPLDGMDYQAAMTLPLSIHLHTPPPELRQPCIVNLERNEYLQASAFTDFNTEHMGRNGIGSMSALLALLHRDNGLGLTTLMSTHPCIGLWAGQRIAVLASSDLPAASVNVSRDLLNMFRESVHHRHAVHSFEE